MVKRKVNKGSGAQKSTRSRVNSTESRVQPVQSDGDGDLENLHDDALLDNINQGKTRGRRDRSRSKEPSKRRKCDNSQSESDAEIEEQPTQTVHFQEDDNDVVMEVTDQQESEFMSEENDSDDYQQQVLSMQDAEFEDAMSENNNAVSSEIETVVEVPLEIRKLYEDGIQTQKKQAEELANSREEIKALKDSVARFEQMFSKQPIYLKNPEYRIRSEVVKPKRSNETPDHSKARRPKQPEHRRQSRGKDVNVEHYVNEGLSQIRSNSATTVYQPAVMPESNIMTDQMMAELGFMQMEDPEIHFNFKRSSSSEEENEHDNGCMVSSDEFVDEQPTNLDELNNLGMEGVADVCEQPLPFSDRFYEREPEPSTSRRENTTQHDRERNYQPYKKQGGGDSAKQFDDGLAKTDQLIWNSERNQIRMYEVPGELQYNVNRDRSNTIFNSVDDDYIMVAAHVDQNMERKIAQGDYIDFTKLIPRDRLSVNSDHCMELVSKGGMSYFVPVSDREAQHIQNFHIWEKAFRVFSHIYMRYHPARAVELIEYNHLIHSASLSFAWDNMYAYDRDFRMHLARHPNRSWGLILQQAWSFRLKDRIRQAHSDTNGTNGHYSGQHQNKKNKEACYRFNRGRCTYGDRCKFDHRCLICGKYGHGAHNCRRGTGGNGNVNKWDKSDKHDKHDKADAFKGDSVKGKYSTNHGSER